MLPTRQLLLVRGWSCGGAPSPAIETGALSTVVRSNRLIVDARNVDRTEIVHRAIIGKPATIPTPALITVACKPEAVVDATVETDFRRPLTGVKSITTFDPTPIGRRP
jgi:hypothetical protein